MSLDAALHNAYRCVFPSGGAGDSAKPRTVDIPHPECRPLADISSLPPNVCLSNTNLCRLKRRPSRFLILATTGGDGLVMIGCFHLVVQSIKPGPSTLTHPVLNAGPAPTLPEEQLGTPHPPRFRCSVGFLLLKAAPGQTIGSHHACSPFNLSRPFHWPDARRAYRDPRPIGKADFHLDPGGITTTVASYLTRCHPTDLQPNLRGGPSRGRPFIGWAEGTG